MIACLLVAACAGPQPKDSVEAVDAEAKAAERRAERIGRAQALVERGQPLAAVRVYRRLAEQAEPDEALRWQLRITELLFETGYPQLALAWHRRLEGRVVPAELATRKRLVDARAAVERHQGVRALRLLPVMTSDMPDSRRARILALRADAYAVSGQPERALQARLERVQYLETQQQRRQNQEALWSVLQSMPADRLRALAERDEAPDVVRGWVELAQAVRRARLGERGLKKALAQWRERFDGHPAEPFSRDLQDRVLEQFEYPDKLALLLPLSGRLAEPAKAVRDGLLAAYYDQPDYVAQPQIAIYDTGGDGMTVDAAYDRAVREGAGFVIGPLAKEAVETLAARESLDVPVLSLNYPRNQRRNPPDNLYRFGLLPEDEARQAAEAATQNGHFNAVVLTPSGSWGRRLLGAFRERFDTLGGEMLEYALYDPRRTDYGRAIKSLLNLDASSARHRRLESTIKRDVRFEPRRRQDVEVIFAPAQPDNARLIKPQLEFHRAADLPVYATSHAYTGTPDPDADGDINGLNFTETPWILDSLAGFGDPSGLYRRITAAWPRAHARAPRLYALGIDAFSLLPHLARLREDATAGLAGRTGRLTVDANNDIHRKLQWARFVRGVPMAVPRPEAPIGPHFDDWLGLDAVSGNAQP